MPRLPLDLGIEQLEPRCLLSGGVLTISGTTTLTNTSLLFNNPGGLFKVGPGTLPLTGINSFDGNNLNLSGGTLQVGNNPFDPPGVPSVWVEDRILYVVGSGKADVDELLSVTANGEQIHVSRPDQFINPDDIDGIVVDGRGGNDAISVAASTDFAVTIRGGDGNDRISASGERFTVLGGAGDDTFQLNKDREPDVIDGGDGSDGVIGLDHDVLDLNDYTSVENGQGKETIIGTDGPNVLAALDSRVNAFDFDVPGPITVVRGYVTLPEGATLPDGKTLPRLPFGGGGTLSTSKPELLTIPAPATIFGGGGDDTIVGGAGSDRIDGGDGNDSITGGGGHDRLDGASGDDKLQGGGGDDTMYGRGGRDRLYGGDDRDRLAGNGGRDFLFGESEADRLYGGAADDVLDGGSSNDRLQGDEGSDVHHGQNGNDRFFTRDSIADQLFGGRDADACKADDEDVLADIESAE